jgi:hypothetical protein
MENQECVVPIFPTTVSNIFLFCFKECQIKFVVSRS